MKHSFTVETDYSKRGQALRALLNESPRTKKFTLYMAIDKKRIVGYNISKDNANSMGFLGFLQSLELQKGDTVLMDNVAFHKTKKVKKYLDSIGVSILFIPPYSPQY